MRPARTPALAVLLAAAALACRHAFPAGVELSHEPGRANRFEVVSSRGSRDGREAELRLSAPSGIFRAFVSMPGERLRRLVLVVLRQSHCEGLEFQTVGGGVNLRRHPDVKVSPRGADLEIEIGPRALADMGREGVLQFVDLYR